MTQGETVNYQDAKETAGYVEPAGDVVFRR